ncbi:MULTISPECIES: hypothetical protein [unclassified Acinetobacter]|uniref:hypothetical protein n=1 Tax=unclassified Acinetobacter TaxID=196816 RepID=UPI0029344C56|nr:MULTISPECIES: hypothetical protein [unclassified Acinetobacter]WOE32703.1 hypothetical protein QSG84_05845 [Acinetobacter sp. SAAs470]WOE38179.1 hypothetical protein QSG86_14900 [Acinetobacter sp. SAAs474]
MAPRKKHTSFYPWIDRHDHRKGFKMNFSMVTYIELGHTAEGYKQVQFVGLKHPEQALDYPYPEVFYLSTEGMILIKTAQGQFESIAKTDHC